MANVQQLGPLDWRIPIVTADGRPTSEFQRRWALQMANNSQIGGITLGAGPPPAIPAPANGAQYADTSTNPYTIYIASGGTWHLAGSPTITGANPTATASDVAVNGSANTFMRSDASPAVQKASSSQFGIVKVDGTTITESGGVISATGGGGGGGSWKLLEHYNAAIDGPTNAVDVTDFQGCDDLMFIVKDVTTTSSSFRQVYVSTNGGSTYYNTSGDYVEVPTNGNTSNVASIITHGTATTGARSVIGILYGVTLNGPPKLAMTNDGDTRLFVANTNPINAVRVFSTGGNFSAGDIFVYGK